jgi:hypothetical protein
VLGVVLNIGRQPRLCLKAESILLMASFALQGGNKHVPSKDNNKKKLRYGAE